VGVLIALFERTVGLYASLINVNAYHQPGVEAGKKAAEEIISIQQRILSFLAENKSKTFHVEQIASGIGTFSDVESVFRICEHLSANRRGIVRFSAEEPFRSTYQAL
jgi:glucose-6-phosphate isomerase